jgi:hypothetical protein
MHSLQKRLSKKGSDDFQTPEAALLPLLPFLRPEWDIWEPAAGEGSIVVCLKAHGYVVYHSDIRPRLRDTLAYNFLASTQAVADELTVGAIVTNPPYSRKTEFVEACYRLDRPFALLLSLTALETSRRARCWREGLEMLV